MIVANIIAVCNTSEIIDVFFSPIHRAIKTFAPIASPVERVTRRATISPFVPTAARAFASAK